MIKFLFQVKNIFQIQIFQFYFDKKLLLILYIFNNINIIFDQSNRVQSIRKKKSISYFQKFPDYSILLFQRKINNLRSSNDLKAVFSTLLQITRALLFIAQLRSINFRSTVATERELL